MWEMWEVWGVWEVWTVEMGEGCMCECVFAAAKQQDGSAYSR